MPKDQKQQTVAVRLHPARVEAIEALSRRGDYSNRTAFIELAVERAIAAGRRRISLAR